MIRTARLYLQRYTRAEVNLIHISILFRVLAIALGGLHAIAAISSQSMNADGISYLDIGDAYFRADWQQAINPVWSPLYSLILGFANLVIKPSMQWEFAIVHLCNFLVYVGALASFEFMWSQARPSPLPYSENRILRIPGWLWWTLGYLLFIWTSLSLIQIWSVTPDMLMAMFVFLASGLIAQIRSGDENPRKFLVLGLVLGLGYLTKTFMFSMALVFLLLAWFVQKRSQKAIYRTSLALSVFLLFSLPFVLLISEKRGKLTIGEAGTVTFLRYVNGIPFPHWQGDLSKGMPPTHPSRIIHQSPRVYEFSGPVGGTYPISTDPSYWYEGIESRFDLASLSARLTTSSLIYLELFLQKQGVFLACVLALYMMGGRPSYLLPDTLRRWALLIPSMIALGLYASVLVQARYIGVFLLLFWTDILANIRLDDTMNNRSWLKVLSIIAALGLLANIVLFNLDGFKRLHPTLGVSSAVQTTPPARPLAVAQALQDLGIQPGDKVGVIGYGYDSFWARLARVQIVAELLERDAHQLWSGDQVLQQSVLQAFKGADVSAVIAEYVPDDVQLHDWHRVGASTFYIYRFEK